MNCKKAETLGRVKGKEGEGEEREKKYIYFFRRLPLPVSFYRRNANPKSRYLYLSQFSSVVIKPEMAATVLRT